MTVNVVDLKHILIFHHVHGSDLNLGPGQIVEVGIFVSVVPLPVESVPSSESLGFMNHAQYACVHAREVHSVSDIL